MNFKKNEEDFNVFYTHLKISSLINVKQLI